MKVQPDLFSDRSLDFLGHIIVGLVNLLIIFVLTSVEFVKLDFQSIFSQIIDSLTSLELNIQLLSLIAVSSYILGLVINEVYGLLNKYTIFKPNIWIIRKIMGDLASAHVRKKVSDYFNITDKKSVSDFLSIVRSFTIRNKLINYQIVVLQLTLFGGFALSLFIYSIVLLFTISNNNLVFKFVLLIFLLLGSFFFHFLRITILISLYRAVIINAYSYIIDNEKKKS